MKKILTICIFAFALLISSQGFAQLAPVSNASIDKIDVKEKVVKISNDLGLNENQIDAFANAYINKEKALKETDDKAKVQQKFLASLKGILTENQITKLKSLNLEN